MRNRYDFSKMKERKNPYLKDVKQPETTLIDRDVVADFKAMAKKMGIPYQSPMNLYLALMVVGHSPHAGNPRRR